MALVIPVGAREPRDKTALSDGGETHAQLVFALPPGTLAAERNRREKVMMEPGQQAYLLFDGDCGICSWSAQWVQAIDRRKLFVVQPYQSFPETELQPLGITYAQCAKKMQVISRRGKVYRGAFGVNYFLWQYWPWKMLVALIYAVPIVLVAELIVYAIVASQRHRLSQWLGLQACALKR